MPLLILQHVDCETAGTIEELLRESRLPYRYVRSVAGEAAPDSMEGWDGLIIMGGPMVVYDAIQYPCLAREIALIRDACDRNIPVLGICLGSQLLAAALGATVAPGARKEIGWHPVRLLEAAQDDLLFQGVPAEFTALHWHGDIFELPPAAVPLASSELTKYQAFRWGRSAYGILFHMETTTEILNAMSHSFQEELRAEGIQVKHILTAAEQHLPALAAPASTVFCRWLNLIKRA